MTGATSFVSPNEGMQPPASPYVYLVRSSDLIINKGLVRCLRDEYSDGAVIEAPKVYALTCTTAFRMDAAMRQNGPAATIELLTSFARSGYSPVVILGTVSTAELLALRAASQGKHLVEICLYLGELEFSQRYQRERRRLRHLALSPPDLLTQMRANRVLTSLDLDAARHENRSIRKACEAADFAIDASGMDDQSVLSLLISTIRAESKARTHR